MNRLADLEIDSSLVDPMSPDQYHQQTSNTLRSNNVSGLIRRTVSVEMTFAPRSTMQGFLCQSTDAKTVPGKIEAFRRQTASVARCSRAQFALGQETIVHK